MSSASRASEAVVKPTRSAKRTETSRRSAAGASATGLCSSRTSASPHSPQNFVPAALGVPHAGQAIASEAPHSPQNFRPASFSEPQAAQAIMSEHRLSLGDAGDVLLGVVEEVGLDDDRRPAAVEEP